MPSPQMDLIFKVAIYHYCRNGISSKDALHLLLAQPRTLLIIRTPYIKTPLPSHPTQGPAHPILSPRARCAPRFDAPARWDGRALARQVGSRTRSSRGRWTLKTHFVCTYVGFRCLQRNGGFADEVRGGEGREGERAKDYI